MASQSVLAQLASVLAGAASFYAAQRGWLGWRLQDRRRALLLAAAVVLAGGAVVAVAVEAVRTGGVVGFGIAATAVAVVVLAGARQVRLRWPTLGPPVLALVAIAVVVPGLRAPLLSALLPLAIVGALFAWVWTRLVRRT